MRFFDLYDAVRASGHELWISVPTSAGAASIGNALEYGVGYTPYGEHASHLCGLEAVLPNGELVRTGMGALGNGRAWHVYRRSFGPSFEGMFFQSNLGIVTRAGVWLMPQPECFLAGWAYCRRDEDLGAMVDTLRELLLDGSITGYPQILSPTAIASVFMDRTHWYDGDGVLPDEVVERICSEMDVGRWTMRFAIHGDEAIVDHKFAKVQRAFGQIAARDRRRHEVRRRRGAHDRQPGRARPGRGAEPRDRPDGEVVRRRAGRPHRLLPGSAAQGGGRSPVSATCCAARLQGTGSTTAPRSSPRPRAATSTSSSSSSTPRTRR